MTTNTMTTSSSSSSSDRPAPSYASVWATLTRNERLEIRSLIDRASRCHDVLVREDSWSRDNLTAGERVISTALADEAWQAQAQAHALWRGHGFSDLPTYQMRSLVG